MDLNKLTKHPIIANLYITKCGKIFEIKELRQYNCATLNKIPYAGVYFKKERYLVHRLVAETYLENPDNKPYVCHKDDNPQNNDVQNLWWGTPKENAQDMINKGRSVKSRGKRAQRRLLVVLDLKMKGLNNREIATILKISESRVSQIITKIKTTPKH